MNIVFSTNPDFNYHDEESEVETLAPEKQKLRVSIERHHRGGKTVTLVKGFVGTGGSAKEGEIVIQGEIKEKVVALLQGMGYTNSK